MKRRFVSTALVTLSLLLVSPSWAGKYNDVLSIGDKAPEWKDLPGTDDKKHSLADFADKDILVVVFTCNSCPYAVDYEDRLVTFVKEMSDSKASVGLVAINVNKIEEDKLPAMKKRAESKKFNFPYLFDETQKVAKDYGAVRTPEFFVFNKDRQLIYTGAMDDSPDGKKVTKDYLREAITATTSGKKIETEETPPVGCGVRFDRVRRQSKKQ
ncbi:thioredoxin family protein [bacterium]|nr:thioredoxin family protein [bacterium]